MKYEIIQPPFTLVFREMSKKELKSYYEWFMKIMPERIEILTNAVKSTPGFEDWIPDYSPDTLNKLGEWFYSQVETRPRTQEETDAIQGRFAFSASVPEEELTNKTFSLAIDIGMYVSQVFIKNHSVKWNQPLSNKRFVDYGQPVLEAFKSGPFNPVSIMVTLAYGLARKTKTGQRLRELYDIWSNMLVG